MLREKQRQMSFYSSLYGKIPANHLLRRIDAAVDFRFINVRIIEEASCNLAYIWFLGLNPEDNLPDASLLAKFRTQRLKDLTLDEVICEIVRQCVENGTIKGTGVTIDTTHIEANRRPASFWAIKQSLS